MKLISLFTLAVQAYYVLAEGSTSLYDEAIPMVWVSSLVYSFADLIHEEREGRMQLKYPSGTPKEELQKFKEESLDLRGFSGNSTGMPFAVIAQIISLNEDKLVGLLGDDSAKDTMRILSSIKALEDEDASSHSYFLETFRSINQARQCVYGVVKDTKNKRITVVFRGSMSDFSTRDWESNFKSFFTNMRTPKLLKDKMKGKAKEFLPVHQGFFEYLFDNKKIIDGEQRYDMILSDIKPILEEGYEIFVTGHSLGAALSSLAAFKLAGSEKEWIPKPITCISFASPRTAGSEYRTAFEQLEKDGLLRYIRVNNNNDIVPASPPAISLKSFKHVGINIRLYDETFPDIVHSSRVGWKEKFQNSFLKPTLDLLTQHGTALHEQRMNVHTEALKNITIEDLYNDLSIIAPEFIRDEL